VRHLKPSTSSTTLPPGRVGRNGGDVLDSSDPHTGSSETSESRLGTRSGLLGTGTTGGSELDVKGGDTDFLALGGNVLRGQHGGVGLKDEAGQGSDRVAWPLKRDRQLTEDSSRSALTFIPPVTREMVSFPERSVT